jgi:hypothetical protein
VKYAAVALAVAALAAGCFDPRYGEGAACSERQTCPPGQTCDGMFCRPSAGPASDAAEVDGMTTADAGDLDAADLDAADLDASSEADASVDALVDAGVDATVDAAPPLPCNARGTTATSNSTYDGYSPSKVNDGDPNTGLGPAYSWSNEVNDYPAWVELALPVACDLSAVVLYTTDAYRIGEYEVQVLDVGSTEWVTVDGDDDNTAVMREHVFAPRRVTAVRILGHAGPPHQLQHVRVNELELR